MDHLSSNATSLLRRSNHGAVVVPGTHLCFQEAATGAW
jgi:hypothetical protein